MFKSLTTVPQNMVYLVTQAPIAMALLKGTGMIVEVANEKMLHIWGKTKDAIGLPLKEALPEISDQGFLELLEQVFSSGVEHKGYETQAKLIRNGQLEVGYFDFSYSPIRDESEKIVGVAVVANEVTSQVLARAELEASERRFKNLILDADVATAVYLGEEMIIHIANDAMLAVWGKGTSVIGKKLKDALPELDGQPFHGLLQQVYTTGQTYKAREDRADLVIDGRLQSFFYNFSYKALRNADGEIYGIVNMAVDVTQQVLAKRQAQENELKFRNLIKNAPVGIAVIKCPEMIVETSNDVNTRLWGNPRDIHGTSISDILNAKESADFLKALHTVADSGKPFTGKEIPLTVPGAANPVYLNFLYHPVLEDGRVTSIISIAYDVTEQVISRQLIEDSEKRFRSLVDEAPVPTAILRGENMVLELVNDTMLMIWGKDRSILGKPLLEFLPEMEGQKYPEWLATVYHTGEEFRHESSHAIIMIDGKPKEYFFNFTYKRLTDASGDHAILVMCIDVTEQVRAKNLIEASESALRLSEARLTQLADSMPQHVWTTLPDGSIDFTNKVCRDYFGLDANAFTLLRQHEFIHQNEVENGKRKWAESLQKSEPFEMEFNFRSKDGNYRTFLSRALPVRNEDGEIIRWIGTNTDIDEFKKMERQKDDFLAIASHELKTPVTSIKAYTQVLESMLRKDGDDTKADMLRKMDNQINKFTALIGDLLDTTKIQTGKLMFNRTAFDFNDLAKEIIEEVQRTSSRHHLLLQPSAVGTVFADRDRVGQVITNFLTNAIKYSPDANEIIVRTIAENGEAKLSVQDFGIGIAADKKDLVFQQFYRVSGPREYTFPGIGLGLYICAEIVKREGGRIWVDSEPGQGSTFCFTLPLNQ